MRLTDFLEPELILIDLDTHGVEDTIAAMVDHLHSVGHIADPDVVREAVITRESSHTTALGNGAALPHACLTGLDQPRILVATAPEGVAFSPDSAQAEPERLFFLLLSPMDEAGAHIKLLARIVRLVRHSDFVDTLVAAESPAALIEAVEREEALHV